MRLHTLHISAFGPFARPAEVDFDALHDAGLFLLAGPTGAGKTSVLDAVVFALYGVVPGARHGAARLRSDHAGPDAVASVVLEFSCRGRRLRVSRRPAWDRPKRRGTGTVREQAAVLLEEISGEGRVTLSTRLDEAGLVVRDLLGLSPEQFCQVVLLPQGEFARFLHADAETRRAILQALFGTERFAAVEAELAERRRSSARRLERTEEQLRLLLARVAQEWEPGVPDGSPVADVPPGGGIAPVADVPPGPTAASDGADAGWPDHRDRLDAILATARAEADRAARAVEPARHRCAEARTALEFGRRSAQARTEARALQERLDGFAVAATGRDALRTELDAAQRVAAVTPLIEAHDTALREHGLAVQRRDLTRGRVMREVSESGEPGSQHAQAAALRELAARLQSECGLLESLRVEERQLAGSAGSLDRVRAELAAARSHLDTLAERRAALPRDREEADGRLERARDDERGLARLAPLLQAAAARRTAAHARDLVLAQLAEARSLCSVLVDAAQDARARWLDARAARLDAMAAELAGALIEGEPCPVCGAAVHPVPAAAVGDEAADERAAQRAAELADRERYAGERTVAALEARLSAAAALAGLGDAVELEAEEVALAQRVGDLRAGAADLAPAEAARRALEAEERALGDGIEQAIAAVTQREAALTSAQAALLGLERRLLDARGADPTVSDRVRRLRGEAADAVAAAVAVEQALRTGEAVARTERAAHAAAAMAGVGSFEQARAVRRPAARVRELADRLAELDGEEAALRERCADPAFAGDRPRQLLLAPEPDLELLAAHAASAALAESQATTCAAIARHRSAAVERLAVEVESLLEELIPLREKHDVLARLSGLVEGSGADNTLRMRLSAYAVAARLEQVADAASERLLRMTSGRFSLAHTARSATARGRAGLGLVVLDAWTGVERDPATLSGGEAFCASLALALGLADVVAAEAGGVVLETLFIDEGFGSLDDESLDDVLDVLDGLREGGRAVGVVSHVAELRTRVPAQVQVAKHRDGSTLRVVGCAGRSGAASPAEAAHPGGRAA